MTDAPTRRVVLLGASNVSISLRRIVGLVRGGFEGPLDVHAAHGHGRSYGATSWIPGRSLPGILRSRLWSGLANSRPAPVASTHVLLTDIGNDLIYGTEPHVLLSWVERCIDQLAGPATEFVVTRLPIARMEGLSERHYRWFVRLLFPSCNVTFGQMRERARAVDAGVAELAAARGAATLVPPAEWYGTLDPIHIRPDCRPHAWRTILGSWPSLDLPRSGRPQPVYGPWSWLSHRPAERTLLGVRQETRQPIVNRLDLKLHVY